MPNIRNQAKAFLNAVPLTGEIRSTDPRFERLTNTSHKKMADNWKTKGGLTACNGFVNWYAIQLHITGISDWFNLKRSLFNNNKGHAWVESTEKGPRPEYGDILKHRPKNHVDVAIGFDGPFLLRAAAGQGGPLLGYDRLMRVRDEEPYNWQNLEGWLNIERYFLPVPYWLVGWWRVTWRGRTYYYYFDHYYKVKWTQIVPTTAQPRLAASDTGNFAVNFFCDHVTINWRATGSVEKFSRVPGTNNQMEGKWNEKERLTAVKM